MGNNKQPKRDDRTKEQKSKQRAEQLKSQRRPSLNERANQAAKYWGLNARQKQLFHRELSSYNDDDLTYEKLKSIAYDFKNR